jgi:hypothetical protein
MPVSPPFLPMPAIHCWKETLVRMNARHSPRPSVPADLWKIIAAALLAGLISSCAMTGNARNEDIEQDLAAAGFRKMPADTPGKLAQIRTLPQRQVVPYQKNGADYYLYADAALCKCLYEGTQEAYRRYQLARTRKAAGGAP